MLSKKFVSLVCIALMTQVSAQSTNFTEEEASSLYSQIEENENIISEVTTDDQSLESIDMEDSPAQEQGSSSAEVSASKPYEEVVVSKVTESESDKKLNIFLKGAFVVINAALFVVGYGATKLAPGKRA